MSIFPLERLFDTAETIEQAEREKKQDLAGTRKRDDDPPMFRCRVCALEGENPDYCPRCLADTMVKAR